MPPRARTLSAHERSLLSGVAFDIVEFERFVTRQAPSAVRPVMTCINNLCDGTGIRHANASGTFYAGGHGQAFANTTIRMDQDFVALRLAAKAWIPPRPHPTRRHDPSRGWLIDDPIGRLIKFQVHKFERAWRASSATPREDTALQDAVESPAPATPVKKKPAANKRPREETTPSHREDELSQQLAVAQAEPWALEKLSLSQTRILKRELQSALHRCQQHEEKLETAERECVICFDALRQVCFAPCGHYAACADCSRRMDDCPICKEPIRQRTRIYEATQ
jgi:hypothetical protein